MDFSYTGTSCHSPGGTLHLSPSHVHHMDSLAAVSDIRRSLSRSPSRFQSTFTPARPSQPSSAPFQHLPLSIRKMSTTAPQPSSKQVSPPDFSFPATAKKNRPIFRRTTPHRMLSHTPLKTPAKTPIRRALSDASDHGNASTTPGAGYRGDGQENSSSPEASPSNDFINTMNPGTPFVKIDHEFSPFNFSLTPSRDNIARPTRFSKSSPLKNGDGVMNMDRAHLGSPGGKRKMVSGGFSSSPFDIAVKDTMMMDAASRGHSAHDMEDESQSNDLVGSPPPPRMFTLRRSSRIAGITDRPHIRSRRSVDATLEAGRSPRLYAKTRSRASMDSGIPISMSAQHDIFSQDDTFSPIPRGPNSLFRAPTSLSPIAPSPPKEDELAMKKDDDLFQKPALPKLNFSKSLPIGAVRPKPRSLRGIQDLSQEKEFATPEAYKMAKPHPAAFMSTGLISKRHRNPDDMPAPPAHQGMPDTPCKKLPPGFNFQSSPAPSGPTSKLYFPQPSFGTPSKPFNMHSARGTPATFGKSTNIFGSSFPPNATALERRASYASITSIDGDEPSQSPLHLAHMDSQSSADELPPTPTKHDSRPKPNSLRSKLLGRRPAVNTNTFLPPTAAEQTSLQTSRKSSLISDEFSTIRSSIEDAGSSTTSTPGPSVPMFLFARSRLQQQARRAVPPSPSTKKTLGPSCLNPNSPPFPAETSSPPTVFPLPNSASGLTPKTPAENTFSFPDPSSLSISPRPNTPFLAPGPHHHYHQTPETPTHRDAETHTLAQSMNQTPSNHVALGHDVDADLATKFRKVEWYGKGEFSEVYKVSETAPAATNAHTYFSTSVGQSQRVFIVKKSRSPIMSTKIMQKKLREVKAMQDIGSSEHIVPLINHWEAHHHLYIQLEFCEEGSLEDFLFKTGRNGRLDDFRIWKILTELCDVSFLCLLLLSP